MVAEERLSSVEDNVDGMLDELMFQQAFKKHPYRWPVIGSMKDIKAFTQEKAAAFYRKYYAPNNAVVVVAGRIDEPAMLQLIADAYGSLPASTTTSRAGNTVDVFTFVQGTAPSKKTPRPLEPEQAESAEWMLLLEKSGRSPTAVFNGKKLTVQVNYDAELRVKDTVMLRME